MRSRVRKYVEHSRGNMGLDPIAYAFRSPFGINESPKADMQDNISFHEAQRWIGIPLESRRLRHRASA